MNAPVLPATTFGPVIVADKRLSSSGGTIAVKLHQEEFTAYPPGTREHLSLQGYLNADKTVRLVKKLRKTTQRLLPNEADMLVVGQPIAGHIIRTLLPKPRFSGQKPHYDGGYASSTWSPDFGPDVDLRTT